MSIKHGLMALLWSEPMYGAQLRSEFERRTGSTWPLNIGQVYTTLARLERDGLVETGNGDTEPHRSYRLTPAGRTFVAAWWQTPVERESAPRSELAIKLALAVTVPGVDVVNVVQRQRTASLQHLQDLTRLKRQSHPDDDLAWTLVLEHLIFTAEAETRWLDHVEAQLARQARRTPTSAPVVPASRPAGHPVHR